MDPLSTRLAFGAAGAAGAGEALGIEDVFSTWLYTGNGSTQTITNGIDLAGKGGLVWIKGRSGSTGHRFTDTSRGATKSLASNGGTAEVTETTGVTSFSSTGFAIGADTDYNTNADTYTAWTFRKAPGFFDVVTYTGNGSNRTIAHSLGSVPGCIIVKRTDTTSNWQVYHRSLGETDYLVLNTDAGSATSTTRWNSTTPTSTEFSLGTDATVNANSGTYVAYLFAHDAGGFGDSGSDSVVRCNFFTTDGTGAATVNLGWEPQWLLYKRTDAGNNWHIIDNMRGFSLDTDRYLQPNTSNPETTSAQVNPTSTGFTTSLASNYQYIYIAIRRGPMKTPTDATKVFGIEKLTGTQSSPAFRPGVITDMGWARRLSSGTYYGNGVGVFDRLRGDKGLATGSTAAEFSDSFGGDNMIGFYTSAISGDIGYSFRRAPGFFDVVAYTGTGSLTGVNHNLGVTPELKIIKKRSSTSDWIVGGAALAGENGYIYLNSTAALVSSTNYWDGGDDSATQFSVRNTNDASDLSGATYIAYLFATCPGVSKVGSYTGTGTTKQIDCGFTSGARFVLIKRTDSTGDWYVWDSARGIVSGNDPYLLLNSSAAEVTSTDYIDPLNSGFEISSSAPAAINANGGSFIFLAIA